MTQRRHMVTGDAVEVEEALKVGTINAAHERQKEILRTQPEYVGNFDELVIVEKHK